MIHTPTEARARFTQAQRDAPWCVSCRKPLPSDRTRRNRWSKYLHWVCDDCAYNPRRRQHGAKKTNTEMARRHRDRRPDSLQDAGRVVRDSGGRGGG